jgi:hypothetical protein
MTISRRSREKGAPELEGTRSAKEKKSLGIRVGEAGE